METKTDVPAMSKTLRLHLEKYKAKLLRLGFTPKRSFIVDSCDFIIEEGRAANEQNKNFKHS